MPNPVGDKLCRVFRLLTAESLDQAEDGPHPGLSRINADGLPFQWVLRVGGTGAGFGFLCEAGTPGDTPRNRYALSRQRLRSASGICGRSSEWLDAVANLLVPQSENDWPEHWRSALWVGVAPSPEGIVLKPYFNLNAGNARDRWMRAGRVLQALGRNRSLASLCELSSQVSQDSWPVGLAVDALPSGACGRVKIYFYSDRVSTDWLQRWYVAVGCIELASLARRFLDAFPFTQQRRYPRGAFVVGLEFHPSTERVSLKTDLAITKWMASDAHIARGAEAMTQELGGSGNRVNEHLAAIGVHPANDGSVQSFRFVGLGHEPNSSSHLNMYLAPARPGRITPIVEARSTPESVRAGVQFLLRARRGDRWVDFDLPVGGSDAWVTAYTLARLGAVGRESFTNRGLEAISRSLDWLSNMRSPGGGWSYNPTVPNDADSTAWAILALRRYNRAVSDEARRFVSSCRESSGWFVTYPSDNSGQRVWRLPAPDVTVTAMRALGEPWSDATESRFRLVQCKDSTIPAYWWTSPFYTVALLVEGYPELSSSRLSLGAIDKRGEGLASEFDLALLLLIHSSMGNQRCAARIAKHLRLRQRSDGSWPPSAVMRLPPPQMHTPWNTIDSGPLYIDVHGVFTTATAVAALSAFARLDG